MSLDNEAINNLFNHVMEIWVNPEIERRVKEGKLPKNYFIERIQIIAHADGIPKVRLNQEVRAIMLAKAKPGVKQAKKDGDPIYLNEIERFYKIELPEDEDPNVGHLTMLLFSNYWNIYFDFRVNKKSIC